MKDRSSDVLVVFDGSGLGERALHHAIERARALETGVTVLCVIPPRLWRRRRGQFQLPAVDRRDEEFARRQIARAKDLARQKGVKARGKLRRGSVANVLIDEASKGYALLVIGDRTNPSGARSLGSLIRDNAPIEVDLVA
jgi:nucleotide-binding universal stress UspA family protein